MTTRISPENVNVEIGMPGTSPLTSRTTDTRGRELEKESERECEERLDGDLSLIKLVADFPLPI